MATGFLGAAGTDFDDLFDPYIEGVKPSATGLQTANGIDLAHRYAPILYGARGPDTGFQLVAGPDVATLWAAKGTAVYDVIDLPLVSLYSNSAPPVSNAHCAVYFMPDGTVETFVNNPQAQHGTLWRWITKGNPLDYEFRFTQTSGDTPTSGQFGVWLPASGAPGIGFDLYSVGARSLGFTVEVRRIGRGWPNDTQAGNSFSLHYSNGAGGIGA